MSWRPSYWEKINPRPASPFEAGRDIWCRFCSYRNFETGASAMLEALMHAGEKCTLHSGGFRKRKALSKHANPTITPSDFGKAGTRGWLRYLWQELTAV